MVWCSRKVYDGQNLLKCFIADIGEMQRIVITHSLMSFRGRRKTSHLGQYSNVCSQVVA